MILRVEVAAAAHAGRPRGLLPTALGLPREALSLALRLIAPADGRFPLELLLPAPLAVAAGPRRHLTGRHEQALGAQRIQQGAVMGDQQAHALEARKSRRDGLAGGDIDVIGGLVHNKHDRDAARARKLPAAAFAGHRTRCRGATASRLPRLKSRRRATASRS